MTLSPWASVSRAWMASAPCRAILGRRSPRPAEGDWPRDLAIGAFRRVDIGPRVTGVSFPQFRVAGLRQNLVDAAARHHVTAQEQGHQAIAHLIHSPRPSSQAPIGIGQPASTARPQPAPKPPGAAAALGAKMRGACRSVWWAAQGAGRAAPGWGARAGVFRDC